MAKALIGYLDRTRHPATGLATENARLRARVDDLEAMVVRLAEENDRLTAREAARRARKTRPRVEMQPV